MRYKVIQDFKSNCVELFPGYNFIQEKYQTRLELFLNFSQITKLDILDFFELSGLCYYCDCYRYGSKFECNELFWEILEVDLSLPKPTLASEYINIMGQLFLAGYIDFLCEWDDDRDRIDYPTNLSYYKEDKYQAWIYFRDNYFYAGAFYKDDDEDIFIIDGKEYTKENCPKIVKENGKKVTYMGYSTMYSPTSWDTPQYWSQYNVLVARTEKGDKYFNEILAPRFYNKYKDLEVEIDEKGNIIRWIGEIHR